jgi:hypothetical protein
LRPADIFVVIHPNPVGKTALVDRDIGRFWLPTQEPRNTSRNIH